MIDDNQCPAVTAIFIDNASSKTLELDRGVFVIKWPFESSSDELVVRIKAVCLYEELTMKFLNSIGHNIYLTMMLAESIWKDEESFLDSNEIQKDLLNKIRKIFNKYIVDNAQLYSLIDASLVMTLEDPCSLKEPYRALGATFWSICDDHREGRK